MDDLQALRWAVVELQRRLANVVRKGTIHELDAGNAVARVKYEEEPDGTPCVTRWLQWGVRRAGPDRTWWAPEVGEQVVLLSPSGDLSQAVILCALWQDDFPANGDDAEMSRIDWQDGSYLQHDRESGDFSLHATGDILVTAAGNIRMTAQRIDLNP